LARLRLAALNFTPFIVPGQQKYARDDERKARKIKKYELRPQPKIGKRRRAHRLDARYHARPARAYYL